MSGQVNNRIEIHYNTGLQNRGGGGHELEIRIFLMYFFTLSSKMASIFSLHVRIFHKFRKMFFFKKMSF